MFSEIARSDSLFQILSWDKTNNLLKVVVDGVSLVVISAVVVSRSKDNKENELN